MTFRGMERIRNKIYGNDSALEYINTFNYFVYNISYERDKHFNVKTAYIIKIQC
jgi:hypothetical protein